MGNEEELPFCECGECDLRVTKPGNRFVRGHKRRNVLSWCSGLTKETDPRVAARSKKLKGRTKETIMAKGKTCLKYRTTMCKEYRDQWGFEAEIEGCRCYVMNLVLNDATSEMFAEKLKEYDICVATVFKNGTWKLSFRSEGRVDVSEIAKKFPGGGGQANAAGAEGLKKLPFNILGEKK